MRNFRICEEASAHEFIKAAQHLQDEACTRVLDLTTQKGCMYRILHSPLFCMSNKQLVMTYQWLNAVVSVASQANGYLTPVYSDDF